MAEHGTGQLDPKVLKALESMGVKAEALDGRTVSQLGKIEAAIEKEAAAYHAARSEMRTHLLTIENVSNVGGVSRPTIYSKKVLMDYIELRREEERVFYDGDRIKKLKKQLEHSEGKLKKMLERDGELVLAYAEIDRLRDRIGRLEKFVDEMPAYMHEELDAMGKVIPFPSGHSGI